MRHRRPEASGLLHLPAYLIAAAAILTAQYVWTGRSYWSFSDGVYLETSRLVLHGGDLYSQIATAQPPALFYSGAGLLAISSSLWWIHAALSLLTLLTSILVAIVVRRLTGDSRAAVVGGLVALLTPWMVREHLALTPETFATPLLLFAGLAASRRRHAQAAGIAAACAVAFKLAFALPLIALVLAVPRESRKAFASASLVVLGILGVVSLVVWGHPLVSNVVTAQREVGTQFGLLPGYLAQAAWNLGPLLLLCGATVHFREQIKDPALLRTFVGLLIGVAVLVGTVVKHGTYLNIIQVIEPVAVALAVPGAIALMRQSSLRPRIVAAAAVVLVTAQTISLLASPDDPVIFKRPLSAPALGRNLSSSQVSAAVSRARACPSNTAYAGPPFIAFLAGRSVPGNQPDLFILRWAPRTHAAKVTQLAGPVCGG